MNGKLPKTTLKKIHLENCCSVVMERLLQEHLRGKEFLGFPCCSPSCGLRVLTVMVRVGCLIGAARILCSGTYTPEPGPNPAPEPAPEPHQKLLQNLLRRLRRKQSCNKRMYIRLFKCALSFTGCGTHRPQNPLENLLRNLLQNLLPELHQNLYAKRALA